MAKVARKPHPPLPFLHSHIHVVAYSPVDQEKNSDGDCGQDLHDVDAPIPASRPSISSFPNPAPPITPPIPPTSPPAPIPISICCLSDSCTPPIPAIPAETPPPRSVGVAARGKTAARFYPILV